MRYKTPVDHIEPGFVRGKLTAIRIEDKEPDPTFGTDRDLSPHSKVRGIKWLCKCECGNEVLVYERALMMGEMISCGCEHKGAPNIVGKRFGKLIPVYQVTDSPDARFRWLCQCDCGNGAVMKLSQLRRPNVSCGCTTSELRAQTATKHGMTETALYKVWSHMRERCTDPKNKSYAYYGGRGIRVCDRWTDKAHGFENFVADMGDGYQPGLQLDRIDNGGPYSPDNCRWVTRTENMRNKGNTIRVDSLYGMLTLGELAEQSGMKHMTLYDRYKKGYPEQFVTVRNCKGLRDLKPLMEGEEAQWLDDGLEGTFEKAYAAAEEEARMNIPHG